LAVRAYLSEKWKKIIDVRVSAVTLTTTKSKVLSANPNRFEYVVINLGTYDSYFSPMTDVSTTKGMLVGPAGGAFSANVDEDGELPTMELWGIADGGSTTLFVLEVIAVG